MATRTSGAPRMVGLPSTGYHKRFAPTKTSGSSANWSARPSRMTTIHLYCNVWSDIGFPSLSGYSISGRGETWVALAMIVEASGTIGNGERGELSHKFVAGARRVLNGSRPAGRTGGLGRSALFLLLTPR